MGEAPSPPPQKKKKKHKIVADQGTKIYVHSCKNDFILFSE
jgi:hypothetical protein